MITGMKLSLSQKRIVSLENLDEFEEKLVVNTPRSLEACFKEGVEPEELLYIPIEKFQQPGLSPRIQKLHYDFFESKRKETLQAVRQARDSLINGSESRLVQSQSSPHLNHKKMFGQAIERAKEKHIKMIDKLISYESKAAEKLLEKQKRDEEKAKKEARIMRAKINEERRRAEEKRIKDLERIQREHQDEKEAKRQAMLKYQQELQEVERLRQIEEEKALEAARRLNEVEEKRMKHIQRVEMNQIELQREKELRYLAKMEEEERRQKRLKKEKKQMLKRMHQVAQIKEIKRKAVQSNQEEMIERRRQEYYERLMKSEERLGRFHSDQRRYMERLRSLSQERDVKLQVTKEQADKLLEERKAQILTKCEQSEQRVEQQKKRLSDHVELKKHISMLKSMKKEWNVKRQKRREEYLKTLNELKMQGDEERIQKFMTEKERMLKLRSDINSENQLQKTKIKQSLYQMAVTKRWDPSQLKQIVESRSNSMSQTSQSFRSPLPRKISNQHHEMKNLYDEAPPPALSPLNTRE
jgi:hypothetical protein